MSENPYASPAEIPDETLLTESDFATEGSMPLVVKPPHAAMVFGIMNRVWGVMSPIPISFKVYLAGMLAETLSTVSRDDIHDLGPNDYFYSHGAVIFLNTTIGFFVCWIILDMVLAVMLFMSGLRLMRGTDQGRVWGLRYCVINLVCHFLFIGAILPALLLTTRSIQQGRIFLILPSTDADTLWNLAQSSMQLSLGFVYPLIQWWQLRKPAFRNQLRAYERWQEQTGSPSTGRTTSGS